MHKIEIKNHFPLMKATKSAISCNLMFASKPFGIADNLAETLDFI